MHIYTNILLLLCVQVASQLFSETRKQFSSHIFKMKCLIIVTSETGKIPLSTNNAKEKNGQRKKTTMPISIKRNAMEDIILSIYLL